MRYILKDYQEDAVREVLQKLTRAKRNFEFDGTPSAFALSATTGAGKTVMAAAVIEAIFEGREDNLFDPDPKATILWFSDEPSLNEQSRKSLIRASEVLAFRTQTIESDFAAERLDPGMVYFLNSDKLSKNGRLVRGAQDDDQEALMARPDTAQHNFWDVLRNTADDGTVVYMFLDEAHMGMNPKNRNTIVRKLVDGAHGAPPVPILFGISATPERFEETMGTIADRDTISNVEVDPARVRDSGIIKDEIVLTFPTEVGDFETTVLRAGAEKLALSHAAWAEYTTGDEQLADVIPLMVVQVPDGAKPEDFQRWISTIANTIDIAPEAFCNVLGEHQDIELPGSMHIPYIDPDKVQGRERIRVVFAKTAISTGWDCPRAEVLVSLRPAKDQTHITQTIGRMVRSPLARRIEGNGLLNSTWCLLPRFDEETTTAVAGRISKGKFGGGGTILPTILVDAIPLGRNPKVEDDKALWRTLAAVPTYAVPRTIRDDIRRLNELSLLLSQHGIIEGCVAQADAFMTSAIRGAAAMYEDLVEAAKRDIETASLRDVTAVVGGGVDPTATEYTMVADDRSIQQSQKTAERGLSGRQLKKYINSLIDDPKNPMDTYEATLQGIAAGWVDEVVDRVRMDAATRVKTLLTETRTARKALSDEERSHYERVIASGAEPLTTDFVLPSKIMVQREQVRDADGEPIRDKYVYTAATYTGHVIADDKGVFPVELNTWEQHVLETEQAHDKNLFWYRNPSRAGSSSVVVPYLYEDEWRAMCPDFIFFTKRGDGVEMNVIDPHGAHLGDALAKLQGLARYAERHGEAFGRIEAVAEIDGTYRVLDMQQEVVRNAVKNASSAVSVYSSNLATDYS